MNKTKPNERINYVGTTVFTLDHRFSDFKLIGEGSYGIVCSSYDSLLHKKVAIKKIVPMAKQIDDAKHVLREIRLMRHMGKHENIVTLEDLIVRETHDELYIVMELLDSDLHRVLQSKQPLTDNHYKYFFFQLICGVKFLHDHRIIHRDLKPGNLLVTKDCKLRITDFGLAREKSIAIGSHTNDNIKESSEGEHEPMTEHVITRWYRPPELMLLPDGMYTYAVDMWSCGCILGEMLGRIPMFPGKNFIHQLTLIFDVIGFPNHSEISHIHNPQALKYLDSQKHKKSISLSQLYPIAQKETLDTIESLLVFNPEKRACANDVLYNSSYLSMLSKTNSQCLQWPTIESTFEFAFERSKATKLQLKNMIILEANSFHSDKFGKPKQSMVAKTSNSTSTGSNTQSAVSNGTVATNTTVTTTTINATSNSNSAAVPIIRQRSLSKGASIHTTQQKSEIQSKTSYSQITTQAQNKIQKDKDSNINSSNVVSTTKSTLVTTVTRSSSAPRSGMQSTLERKDSSKIIGSGNKIATQSLPRRPSLKSSSPINKKTVVDTNNVTSFDLKTRPAGNTMNIKQDSQIKLNMNLNTSNTTSTSTTTIMVKNEPKLISEFNHPVEEYIPKPPTVSTKAANTISKFIPMPKRLPKSMQKIISTVLPKNISNTMFEAMSIPQSVAPPPIPSNIKSFLHNHQNEETEDDNYSDKDNEGKDVDNDEKWLESDKGQGNHKNKNKDNIKEGINFQPTKAMNRVTETLVTQLKTNPMRHSTDLMDTILNKSFESSKSTTPERNSLSNSLRKSLDNDLVGTLSNSLTKEWNSKDTQSLNTSTLLDSTNLDTRVAKIYPKDSYSNDICGDHDPKSNLNSNPNFNDILSSDDHSNMNAMDGSVGIRKSIIVAKNVTSNTSDKTSYESSNKQYREDNDNNNDNNNRYDKKTNHFTSDFNTSSEPSSVEKVYERNTLASHMPILSNKNEEEEMDLKEYKSVNINKYNEVSLKEQNQGSFQNKNSDRSNKINVRRRLLHEDDDSSGKRYEVSMKRFSSNTMGLSNQHHTFSDRNLDQKYLEDRLKSHHQDQTMNSNNDNGNGSSGHTAYTLKNYPLDDINQTNILGQNFTKEENGRINAHMKDNVSDMTKDLKSIRRVNSGRYRYSDSSDHEDSNNVNTNKKQEQQQKEQREEIKDNYLSSNFIHKDIYDTYDDDNNNNQNQKSKVPVNQLQLIAEDERIAELKKRKLTIAKSPKFSKMSWERKAEAIIGPTKGLDHTYSNTTVTPGINGRTKSVGTYDRMRGQEKFRDRTIIMKSDLGNDNNDTETVFSSNTIASKRSGLNGRGRVGSVSNYSNGSNGGNNSSSNQTSKRSNSAPRSRV